MNRHTSRSNQNTDYRHIISSWLICLTAKKENFYFELTKAYSPFGPSSMQSNIQKALLSSHIHSKTLCNFLSIYFLFSVAKKTKKQRVKKFFPISCCVNSTHGGTQVMWYTPFTYRYHTFLPFKTNHCTVADIFCSYDLASQSKQQQQK